jgi:hypothetical protein
MELATLLRAERKRAEEAERREEEMQLKFAELQQRHQEQVANQVGRDFIDFGQDDPIPDEQIIELREQLSEERSRSWSQIQKVCFSRASTESLG